MGCFGSELLTAVQATQCSIIPATQSDQANLFMHWVAFCDAHGHGPFLNEVPPHLHLNFFIVFGCRYRQGLISSSMMPV
jgi:hypothetical protein